MSALHTRIDDQVTRAQAINDLHVWISHARDFIDRVQTRAENSKAFKAALVGLPIYAADWDEPTQNGLDYLQLTIVELLRDVRGEVDADFEAVRTSVTAPAEG